MNRNPLITVIIPVYNVLPYLTEALDSVIRQEYANLEIIIVDDGSTDGSGSKCDEYLSDPRVRVIHQENRGLSGARNVGLDLMTGECVAFLDPDDAFSLGMIRMLVEAMESSRADIVVCGYKNYRGNAPMTEKRRFGLKVHPAGLFSAGEALNAMIINKIEHCVWNKLYRCSLWDGIRFPEGRVYEDICTTYRLFDKAGLIEIIPNALYLKRQRVGSITMTHTLKTKIDRLTAIKELKNYIRDHTPEIFGEEALRQFDESGLRGEMLDCAELMALFRKGRKREVGSSSFISSESRMEIDNLLEKDGISEVSPGRVEPEEVFLQNWRKKLLARLKSTAWSWNPKDIFVRWAFRYCPRRLPLFRDIYLFLKYDIPEVILNGGRF